MALARSRFGDTTSADEIIFDTDAQGEVQFVEMHTRNFKTARIVGMQGEILCLVAPGRGVSSGNWAHAWQ
eukprot:2790119-Amphidinium_carterae.1